LNSRLLIVEDEQELGETLLDYFTEQDIPCDWATSVAQASTLFDEKDPSIVLMDIGLPDGNGIDLAKKFKNQKNNLSVLFLSAQNDPETRVQGLESGADDYITKPFALKELTLRLKRILPGHQAEQVTENEISHGNLHIWFDRYEVQDANGETIPLGQKECDILRLLYNKTQEVISREEIIEKIWGPNSFPSNRTIDNYIVKLRKWCDTDSSRPIEIKSVRGVGYKLVINNK